MIKRALYSSGNNRIKIRALKRQLSALKYRHKLALNYLTTITQSKAQNIHSKRRELCRIARITRLKYEIEDLEYNLELENG